jgi:hypothetical protein
MSDYCFNLHYAKFRPIVIDAQVPVLLTQEKLVEDLLQHQAQIVCLETSLENLSEENPVRDVTPAYIVKTILSPITVVILMNLYQKGILK